MNGILTGATLVVASAWARGGVAANRPEQPAACVRPADEETVVRCALAASPEVREARERLAAVGGRRAAAEVWLPSNPTISGTVSARRRPPPEAASAVNWSVVLSQELEIAGQRSARVDAVEAESVAQTRRVGVAEQEVAAGALAAYYEATAAQEGLRFAADLAQTAESLAGFAEARAKEALLAGVEADVARAEATRIGLARFAARRRLADARAALAVLLDVDPAGLAVPGALPAEVLAIPEEGGSLEEQALRLRGEVAAAAMEGIVLERRLALVRRERIPNPTLSAFAERGEIADRILGIGLSLPIPLPDPVGRTRAGEITEILAQLRAAESSTELVRRRVRLEVARGVTALEAARAATELFGGDLLSRARADLVSLREAIASRQLALREGLQWQRSLIELLQGDIEARLARALAAVELRRVVGLALPGGGR